MSSTGMAPPRLPPTDWLTPDWNAPANVGAFVTTRSGGTSSGAWGLAGGATGGMNVGLGSGDDPAKVRANRVRLREFVPSEPAWLRQVHGAAVARVPLDGDAPPADAAVTTRRGAVCAVMIADCMPVFICDTKGRGVGVAHAGWRGLAAGVLQQTVTELRRAIGDPRAEVLAWCGPAIGPDRFEVGEDVLSAMQLCLPDAKVAFRAAKPGKYYADLGLLARQALAAVEVRRVAGGAWCTCSDEQRFYSYRRDGTTGRHVAVIWLD